MQTTIIQRIIEIKKKEKLTNDLLAERTNIPVETIKSMFSKKTNPNLETIQKIYSAFSHYNLDWLVTGNGEMLREESASSVAKTFATDGKHIYTGISDTTITITEKNVDNLENLVAVLKDKDYIIAKLRKSMEEKHEHYQKLIEEKDKRMQEIIHNSYLQNQEKDEQIKLLNTQVSKLYEQIIELNQKIFNILNKP